LTPYEAETGDDRHAGGQAAFPLSSPSSSQVRRIRPQQADCAEVPIEVKRPPTVQHTRAAAAQDDSTSVRRSAFTSERPPIPGGRSRRPFGAEQRSIQSLDPGYWVPGPAVRPRDAGAAQCQSRSRGLRRLARPALGHATTGPQASGTQRRRSPPRRSPPQRAREPAGLPGDDALTATPYPTPASSGTAMCTYRRIGTTKHAHAAATVASRLCAAASPAAVRQTQTRASTRERSGQQEADTQHHSSGVAVESRHGRRRHLTRPRAKGRADARAAATRQR
jgi:hypothetical protein